MNAAINVLISPDVYIWESRLMYSINYATRKRGFVTVKRVKADENCCGYTELGRSAAARNFP